MVMRKSDELLIDELKVKLSYITTILTVAQSLLTAQHKAPARENRAYKSTPVGLGPAGAAVSAGLASFTLP